MELSRRSVLAGLAALAVAGCSPTGDQQPGSQALGGPQGTTATWPTPSPTPTEWVDETPRWPLTGAVLDDGDSAKAAHPAVAVKIAVEKRSFPQFGPEDADLVFWQAQGNSYDITRLCAIYHSKWPADGAGPIRSARPVDVDLVSPLKGVLASASATDWVMRYIRHHKKAIEYIVKYGDRSARWTLRNPGGWWKGGNQTDKSVIAFPKVMSEMAEIGQGKVPATYLQYAASDDEVSTVNGQAVKQFEISYPTKTIGTEYHRWKWNAKKQLWQPSIRFYEGSDFYDYKVRSGEQIGVPNVLVVNCKWKMGVVDGYGTAHKEPLYSMEDGSDKFTYFHDGKAVTGTWKKGSAGQRFVFTLDDGSFLKMAPAKPGSSCPNTAPRSRRPDARPEAQP
ncbi:MAG: DUF3048 domain-containing protein [Propionibacteriaceae bacterium]|jgi:hypothetical protein|nr:DUF3048 domain-containing protein [Propionibacteriaceae bacterium]